MGCVWSVLSPADSKSQRFPISAQKAGRTTFVVSFSCLAEQCKNYQRTPCWHLPRWSCAWGVFGAFCRRPSPKVGGSPSQPSKAGRTTFVVSFSCLVEQCKNCQRTPCWHLPRWSCACGVFGAFCHRPSPKVSGSPSQPRKQVEQLLWCLSAA